MTWWNGTAKLACILAGVGLAVTRLGLVVHELVGHGGVAVACGGEIAKVRLFYFAGGWIRYELPDLTLGERLAISLGGIAVELVIGLALWLALARRRELTARIARAAGAALVIHGSAYLAAGTYHGFGDGAMVRYLAGDARTPIALAAGAVTVTFGFLGARAILGALAATIPGGRRARIAGTIVAVVIAGGLQGALAAGELVLRDDRTYAVMMRSEREREIAQELARWEAQHRGAHDEAARRAHEAAVRAAQPAELPFRIVLAICTVLAILAGAWRARPGEPSPIPVRLVVVATSTAVASVVLVIALDAAFA